MNKKTKDIPVNTLPSGTREGIVIARTSTDGLPNFKEVERSHRDNGHVFILQQNGTTHIEIDFRDHLITASSIIYIHPDQIHRVIGFDNSTITSWIITSENLNRENLMLLESLAPLDALTLSAETFSIISATAALCIKFTERTDEKLYDTIIKKVVIHWFH